LGAHFVSHALILYKQLGPDPLLEGQAQALIQLDRAIKPLPSSESLGPD